MLGLEAEDLVLGSPFPGHKDLEITHVLSSPLPPLLLELFVLLSDLELRSSFTSSDSSGGKPRAWFVVCVIVGHGGNTLNAAVSPHEDSETEPWAGGHLAQRPAPWPLFCVFSESLKLWLL